MHIHIHMHVHMHTRAHTHTSPQVLFPELRRHKRTFLKAATNQTFVRAPDVGTAQHMFIDYLRDQLGDC